MTWFRIIFFHSFWVLFVRHKDFLIIAVFIVAITDLEKNASFLSKKVTGGCLKTKIVAGKAPLGAMSALYFPPHKRPQAYVRI